MVCGDVHGVMVCTRFGVSRVPGNLYLNLLVSNSGSDLPRYGETEKFIRLKRRSQFNQLSDGLRAISSAAIQISRNRRECEDCC